MKITDEMVTRFLGWSLPKDFAPDGGIKFTPVNHPHSWPVGTNLFTADQARLMLEHILAGTPSRFAPPTHDEIAAYRDLFRAELDKRMDTKHPSASPSTEAHEIALRAFVEKRNASVPPAARFAPTVKRQAEVRDVWTDKNPR